MGKMDNWNRFCKWMNLCEEMFLCSLLYRRSSQELQQNWTAMADRERELGEVKKQLTEASHKTFQLETQVKQD